MNGYIFGGTEKDISFSDARVDASTYAVLHVGMNPYMGVWSAICALAEAQKASGTYRTVSLGVVADQRWPENYRRELAESGNPWFLRPMPKMIGTARAMYQSICRPGLEKWIRAVMNQDGAERVILQLHVGWISGVFLPLPRALRKRCKVVTTWHGINPALARQPIRKKLHAWMAHRVIRSGAVLVSVDRKNLANFESIFGIPPSQFHVIPNTIADTQTRATPQVKRDGVFTVGYVGRISEDKGWRVAAEAVVSLVDRRSDIRLLLVGTGSDQDAAKALAAQYPGRIEYLGFVQNPRDKVMPSMNLLTLMSRYEAFPMSIIEGMSIGLPVAATAVGDIPEQLKDGAGFIVKDSVAELAALIEKLADDPDLLRRTGHAARERFAREYSFERIVEQYDAVYRA